LKVFTNQYQHLFQKRELYIETEANTVLQLTDEQLVR